MSIKYDKMKVIGILIFLVLVLLLIRCKKSGIENHSVRKNGIWHMQGMENPEVNCTTCHGVELTGSGDAPSCYSCHGKLW